MTRSTIPVLGMGSDFSNGITFAETMRLTGNLTEGSGGDINGTFESTDTGSFGKILLGGSGMSVSSGIFTFPATGLYLLMTCCRYYKSGDVAYNAHTIRTTNDNFSSNDIEAAQTFSSYGAAASGTNYEAMSCQYIFDCTNTSTHKFKMKYASSGTITVAGNTDANETYVNVIRLGDT